MFALSALLLLSLTACSHAAPPPDSFDEAAPKTTENVTASRDSSVPYTIGDIILADGSAVKPEDLINADSSNLPIAVIADIKEDGTSLGVGVHRSENPLPWAEDENGNSPAFDFVDTYADHCNISGDYASGWYMPDISELCAIYENRETINTALQEIHAMDPNAAMDGLDTNWYWSSTQSDSNADYAWFVHYFNGYSSDCPKDFTNLHVLAVRIF